MKRALVAGGAGFVGSHLVDRLIKEGYHVTVVDSLVTGRMKNIAHLEGNSNLSFIEADISKEVLKVEGTLDEIYNMASPASPVDFERIPIYILETSGQGHKNLLELAKEKNARVMFASSSEVYGDAEVHPQPETYYGNVNCAGARGCYDEAKRFGEALSMAYRKEFNVETRIVRIFNTYGPRMRPDDGRVIPNFFSQAILGHKLTVYGDGKQTRSLCYVEDLVDGIFKLMQSDEWMPVNVGNPVESSVLDIATEVQKVVGSQCELTFKDLPANDPKLRKPVIEKAQKLLNWEPKWTLDKGLDKTHEYFVKELKN